MDYHGKKVLITGGASGIGQALGLLYGKLGATVLLADKDYRGESFLQEKLRPLGGDCAFYHVDLASGRGCEELMQSIFTKYDDLDILINSAQVQEFSNLTETTAESWDYTLASNLRAPFLLVRDFAKNRAEKGYKERYGRIVNIASSRYRMSEEGTEAYTASKGGLVSLTHALAISLAGHNVTVNAISPGWICEDGGAYEALRYSEHRQHPSGRVGRPEDVARACLFLTHEENDFVNGENMVLDGGMTRKMIYLD